MCTHPIWHVTEDWPNATGFGIRYQEVCPIIPLVQENQPVLAEIHLIWQMTRDPLHGTNLPKIAEVPEWRESA